MGQAAIEAESTKTNGGSSKNQDWKAKAAAPGDWVSTLLRGKHEASTVLIEFRSGRNGAPMLADALPFTLYDGDSVLLSVAPLASECWEVALNHRSELQGARYDYRIRVVSDVAEGEFTVVDESTWIQAPDEIAGDVLSMDTKGADPMVHLLSGMVIKLFSANIQLTRASGSLVRQVTEGMSAGVESQFAGVEKVKQMAQELLDAKAEIAKEQGDAEEVKEFGKTARQWIGMSHEAKLAKQGVATPDVPTTRRQAAISLYNSLTVAQLGQLKKELGDDKAELLVGMLDNANALSDQQVDQLFAEQFSGDAGQQIELLGVAEKVFSAKFVPSTWAIWQTRTATVLISGPDEEPDSVNA
jgi:hypothetical protein